MYRLLLHLFNRSTISSISIQKINLRHLFQLTTLLALLHAPQATLCAFPPTSRIYRHPDSNCRVSIKIYGPTRPKQTTTPYIFNRYSTFINVKGAKPSIVARSDEHGCCMVVALRQRRNAQKAVPEEDSYEIWTNPY